MLRDSPGMIMISLAEAGTLNGPSPSIIYVSIKLLVLVSIAVNVLAFPTATLPKSRLWVVRRSVGVIYQMLSMTSMATVRQVSSYQMVWASDVKVMLSITFASKSNCSPVFKNMRMVFFWPSSAIRLVGTDNRPPISDNINSSFLILS